MTKYLPQVNQRSVPVVSSLENKIGRSVTRTCHISFKLPPAAMAEKRNHGSARILTLTYKLSEPVAQNGNNDIKARRIELVFLNECVPLGDLLGIRRKLL